MPDDIDDDRPARRPRRDDDDDDRPARRPRRDDDDDYDRVPRTGEMGPLDKMFRDTNMVVLILFALCCRGIALILSAVCYFTAKDSKAKSHALVVMCIDGGLTILAIILNVSGVMGGMMAGRGR